MVSAVRESFLRGREGEGEGEGGVISMVEGSAEKEPSGGRRGMAGGGVERVLPQRTRRHRRRDPIKKPWQLLSCLQLFDSPLLPSIVVIPAWAVIFF